MAWSKLEFRNMGTGTVLLYFYRKAVFKEFLRQAPLARSPLHDSPHPPELADFRHNRPQAAWHLFWAFIPFSGQQAYKRI